MTVYTSPARFTLYNEDAGTKPFEEYMNEPSFGLGVEAHPDLVALFARHNFTRRGRFTWSLHASAENGENYKNFVRDYSLKFSPDTFMSSDASAESNLGRFDSRPKALAQQYALNHRGSTLPAATINSNVRPLMTPHTAMGSVPGDHFKVERDEKFDYRYEKTPFGIVAELSKDGNTVYFRLKVSGITPYLPGQYSADPNVVRAYDSALDLVNGIIVGMTTPHPTTTSLSGVVDVYKHLVLVYGETMFTEESNAAYAQWKEIGQNAMFISPVPGKPAQARMVSPFQNRTLNKMGRSLKRVSEQTRANPKVYGTISLTRSQPEEISLHAISGLHEVNKGIEFVVHPSLLDVKAMGEAREYMGEPRLYGYQRRAVGLQLSTNRGFLNALDTGIGKSIVQLTAMRVRSEDIENYRGLIVCQPNTLNQWKSYALEDEWFPEAEVCIINSRKKAMDLASALSKPGPVIILTTFSMAATVKTFVDERNEAVSAMEDMTDEEAMAFVLERQSKIDEDEMNIGELLHNVYWNDVCADEATCIRNGSSQQAQAMWILRRNSEVATALTATPFNKSINDIARLLEWTRNDRRMFYGHSLSSQYDAENITEKNAREIFDTLYPMVFRFTKEEAQAEEESIKIPKELMPETILLDPAPAELALSEACEFELKRIVQELETALDAYEAQNDAEKEQVEKAREELREAHGHWMSGTMLARMATGSPASILKSESVAAQLLIGQGLVQQAMDVTPTKQKVLLERMVEHMKKGQQVLVFTDFVDVANSLRDMFEENGIRAGVFGGSNMKKRDEQRVKFQDGDLDVLVCTKAAERGLTLHKASVVYHYDMSWTLEPLLQKAGRAVRVGSENEEVEAYFLILKGTVEEKVVDKVFTQGSMSSLVLDHSRGVDVSKTTTGKLMGGLMNATENIKTRKGALAFGKALLNV